jgi:hypothetical protein
MRNPKCLKRGKYSMADLDKDVLVVKSSSNGETREIAPPCRGKAWQRVVQNETPTGTSDNGGAGGMRKVHHNAGEMITRRIVMRIGNIGEVVEEEEAPLCMQAGPVMADTFNIFP